LSLKSWDSTAHKLPPALSPASMIPWLPSIRMLVLVVLVVLLVLRA
jgi:hypothetical protein